MNDQGTDNRMSDWRLPVLCLECGTTRPRYMAGSSGFHTCMQGVDVTVDTPAESDFTYEWTGTPNNSVIDQRGLTEQGEDNHE